MFFDFPFTPGLDVGLLFMVLDLRGLFLAKNNGSGKPTLTLMSEIKSLNSLNIGRVLVYTLLAIVLGPLKEGF